MRLVKLIIFYVKVLLLFLIIIATQICCSEKQPVNSLEIIDIKDFSSQMDVLYISDYINKIDYLPLNSDSVMIRRINDIIATDSSYFISDGRNCYKFDKEGYYVSRIGNSGRGPGEYILISNMAVYNKKFILLQSGVDFLLYDLNGEYIRKFSLEVDSDKRPIYSWSVIRDSLLLCQIPNYSGSEEYKAAISDGYGKTIKLFKNWTFWDQEIETMGTDDSDADIYHTGGTIYFKERMSDTLFSLAEDNVLEPVYYFALGKYEQPMSERSLHPFEWLRESQNYIRIRNIYDTENYMFIDCNLNNHSPARRSQPIFEDGFTSLFYTTYMLAIYDKKAEITRFSKPEKEELDIISTGLYNDYDVGPKFYPQKKLNDSTLIMWVEAWMLKTYLNSEEFSDLRPKYTAKKSRLESINVNLEESDNAVLMIVTISE